jgi:hypothetical protein
VEFMRRVNLASLLVASSVVLVVVAGAAFAADGIVEVENLGTTLVFHPMVGYSQLILTVSGPCEFEYRQVVEDGEPIFRLSEETIDGPYTFMVERIEKIDPEIIEVLRRARQEDDPTVPKRLCREGRLPGAPVTQSSGFMVFRGKIVYDPRPEDGGLKAQPDADAGATAAIFAPMTYDTSEKSAGFKDFVINDDLIVDGSACVGFDCVNGESFGFDTIRLKENNLRIKFDDTSTIASYPRNDWQLTANDSANGGAGKFSIDDISNSRTPFTVEANARNHSLYVDDGGRIGNRTATPSTEIHSIDGDTPTLRLQQDGSSGFAPQTWDVAGNETNFFIRDVTNGSRLPFRIRPGAPSSSVFIDVDGDVGLGTSSPGFAVHVFRTGNNAAFVAERTDGATTFVNSTATFGQFGTTTNHPLRLLVDTDVKMTLNADDSLTMKSGATCSVGGSWIDASSRELKEDVHGLSSPEAMSALRALEPVRFRYKADVADEKVGFIAEDVPALVATNDRKGLSPMDIVAVLTKVVQDQEARIDQLEHEIASIRAGAQDQP